MRIGRQRCIFNLGGDALTTQEDPRHQAYEEAREAFERLELPDRFSFLVKEAVDTLVCGIDRIIQTVQEDFDSAFSSRDQAAESDDG